MLSNHAELMRLRIAGIRWGLDLLVAHSSTGQGKHHAELPLQGCTAPALCLNLPSSVSWHYLLACMQGK